jgi:hypothetical protein
MDIDYSSVIIVSSFLVLATVVLMISHVRAWRGFQREDLTEEELDFRRRQFRRRMQTSGMLGLMAVAVAVGYFLIIWFRSGWLALLFGIVLIAMVCWIGLLAIVDVWATKHHFSRMRDRCIVEQAKLRAEINRMEAFRGNGKKDKNFPLPEIKDT